MYICACKYDQLIYIYKLIISFIKVLHGDNHVIINIVLDKLNIIYTTKYKYIYIYIYIYIIIIKIKIIILTLENNLDD